MFKQAIALAQRLERNLVVFDIEHTGGRKEERGITEFAAQIVTPEGKVGSFSSLVNPGQHVKFEPYVVRMTGISRKTVANAPAWHAVAAKAVLPFQDAVWVGFNSRSCDIPVIVDECQKHGLQFDRPEWHLDLMRASPYSGSLSTQVEAVYPSLDTSGAHRAAKDALMTLWLLEAVLPQVPFDELLAYMRPNARKPKDPKARLSDDGAQKPPKARPTPDVDFRVNQQNARKGHPWATGEAEYVQQAYREGSSLEAIAEVIGRSELAVAYVVARGGLLPEELMLKFKIPAAN